MDTSTGSSHDPRFRALPPSVSRDEARRRLRGRRFWPVFRRRLLELELVHGPLFVVRVELGDEASDDDATPLSFRAGVDAISGAVTRLSGGFPASGARPEGAVGEVLPGVLSDGAAIRCARSEVPWLTLRMALKHRRVFAVGRVSVEDRVGYPYWVQHLARGRRRDLRAADGFTGARLGPKTRATLVAGYIRAHALVRSGGAPDESGRARDP